MAGSGLLYWRILRLRRIHPRPAVTFLLFEGSITLGILLSLADVLDWWGAASVPVAVAIMVKLNDVVAVNLYLRPLAEAQLRVPRASGGKHMGVSPVPRVTAEADDPPAPHEPPDRPAAVRGVASVPRRPAPSSPAPVAEAEAAGAAGGEEEPKKSGTDDPDPRPPGNSGHFAP